MLDSTDAWYRTEKNKKTVQKKASHGLVVICALLAHKTVCAISVIIIHSFGRILVFFFCLLIPTTALFSLVSVWLCSDRCFMEQASSVSQKPSSSTKIVSAKVKKAVDSHPEPMNSGHEKPTKSFCPHHHNDHFS